MTSPPVSHVVRCGGLSLTRKPREVLGTSDEASASVIIQGKLVVGTDWRWLGMPSRLAQESVYVVNPEALPPGF
jgi:hypothetical protein